MTAQTRCIPAGFEICVQSSMTACHEISGGVPGAHTLSTGCERRSKSQSTNASAASPVEDGGITVESGPPRETLWCWIAKEVDTKMAG